MLSIDNFVNISKHIKLKHSFDFFCLEKVDFEKTFFIDIKNNPNFFLNSFDHLNDFHCDEVIIGGDFNLVLDLDMDKKGGLAKTHTYQLKY